MSDSALQPESLDNADREELARQVQALLAGVESASPEWADRHDLLAEVLTSTDPGLGPAAHPGRVVDARREALNTTPDDA